MVFGVIISFLILQVTFCQGACPNYWTKFQGSCYHLFSELEPWTQAQIMCTLYDAGLATVETVAENNFLKNMVINSTVQSSVWLGASDALNEGDYRWVGSNLPVTFTAWGPGQPSNDNNNQNCLEFWYNTYWQWGDNACIAAQRFLCEMSDPAVVG